MSDPSAPAPEDGEPAAGGASAHGPQGPAAKRLAFQLPAFAAVGASGFVVDAGITYLGARYLGLSPELARPPGFIVATITNFLLNRAITFRGSKTPFWRAFARYWAVAAGGLAVNYLAYSACVVLSPRFGIAATPEILPLFVAVGVGAAMAATFLGFRSYAFR